MNLNIVNKQDLLTQHPVYNKLDSIQNIQIFMKYHVFAVWDFMSLLKSLQNKITCTNVPWIESDYDPEIVRLINEIVIGEESDQDQDGNIMSHYSLYLKGMDEIGADSSNIKEFVKSLDLNQLPRELRRVIGFHLDIAINGKPHEVAASFFYGREKLIPEMFEAIKSVLRKNDFSCPTLEYYLVRHIELDGDEHGPMAQKCLNKLLDTSAKIQEAQYVAIKSLEMRHYLWDFILNQMS